MGVIQTYKLTGAQLDDNECWEKVGTVLKPTATDVTMEIPISAGGKIELGSLDAYSRSQIWNYLTNSIFRLGSAQADGDATNATSEGCVVYGKNLEGDPMGTSDFSYMRIKPDRVGLYNSKFAGYAGYLFRIDLSSNDCYLRDNTGVKTLQFNRLTGELIINGDLKLQDDQKIVFGTGLDSNIWWDASNGELRLNTTISGVDPTEDYHLTTKHCVNNTIKDNISVARTCFVSPEFLIDTITKRFSTVSAAVSYVTSQVPTSTTPWLIHIYPGTYLEDRGVWIDDDTTSSIVVPDYCFLVGADRDTVIISPDSNVPGEDMNMFGAILEKDKSATASSHIGFSNLTISGCLYGDAIQVDSFIKKPDYPEFRVYVDNVKIINCNTGVKCEERNSWGYINNIYLEDCDIGLHVDDAKMFCNNVVIRQKNSTSALSKGLYSEDKKGKIQVFGLEIGIDRFGLDVAYDCGMYVKDKAEIHVYGGRVDNAQTALFLAEEGEFKGWNVKFHDSQDYDVDMSNTSDNSVEIFAGEFDSPIRNQGGDLKLRNCDINTDDINAHTIQWNSNGKLEILGCNIKSAGQVSTVDYNCVNFTKIPSSCRIVSSAFRYEDGNDKPDYLIYSPSLSVPAMIVSCAMEAGMNGNIKRTGALKHVGGARDYYSTIQDAIDASVAGNLIQINPGTYNEQITLKPDITIEGVDKTTTILTSSSNPIICPAGMSIPCNIKALMIKADIGNTLCDMNGRINFTDCIITDTGTGVGWKTKITSDAQSEHTIVSYEDCDLSNVFEINQSLGTFWTNKLTLRDCMLDGKIEGTFDRGGVSIYDCALDIAWVKITGVAGASLAIQGSTIYSEEEISVELCGTIKVFNLKDCPSIGNDLESAVKFNTVPTTCTIRSNGINGGDGNPSIEVVTGITVDADVFLNNTMNNGIGGAGIFKHTNSTKFVGGSLDCYASIQKAIDGADEGDLVSVSPGTYTEQISAKRGVTIQGLDRSACVLQNTGVGATTYPIADVGNPAGSSSYVYVMKNMTIKTTIVGNLYGRFGNAAPGKWSAWDFNNCVFLNGRWEETNSQGGSSINFVDCNIENDTYGFNLTGAKTGSGLFPVFTNCYFFCSPRFQSTHTAGDANATFVDGCSFEPANSLTIGGDWGFVAKRSGICAESRLLFSAAGRGFTAEDSVFNGGINFTSNPSATTIKNCTFQGLGAGVGDIIASVDITNVLYTGNVQQNGIDGEIKTTNALKMVGGGIDCYRNISEAIQSCTDGETVGITAGDYSEQITIANKSVTLQGVGGSATLTAITNPVITLSKSTGGGSKVLILKQININGHDTANPSFDMNNNGSSWLRVLAYDGNFYTPGNGGAFSLDGSGGCSFYTRNCLLTGEGEDFIHIEATANNNSYVYITQTSHDGARYRFSQGRGAFEVASGVSEIVVESTNTNSASWGWVYSSFVAPIIVNSTTMGINISGCSFTRTGENITMTAINNNLIIKNSAFEARGTNFNISAISSVNMIVSDCPMDNGMSGNVKISKDIKNVAGGVDCYKTITDGINAINGNNQQVVLHADQTITAPLTPPSYALKIDGNHQFSVTHSAGNPLITLGSNDNVGFANIDLTGSIDITGDNAKLQLADHTYLNGMIDVQGGNTNTEIKLDQCRIVADSTDKYCIRLDDVDPTIIVKRSNLKGDASDEAVYWNVDNDNVKVAYSSIMHGSVGASNPFGKSGTVSGTLSVASHHNIYNADPFVGSWLNTISGSNDVFDIDGDF